MRRFNSVVEIMQVLPSEERVIVDVLRQIILEELPPYCREKISFNVPYFYGNKGICIIWPASIPRGGITSGVLLGFRYGSKLQNRFGYLTRGSNKQIYYRVFSNADEINDQPIRQLIAEALQLDDSFGKKPFRRAYRRDH